MELLLSSLGVIAIYGVVILMLRSWNREEPKKNREEPKRTVGIVVRNSFGEAIMTLIMRTKIIVLCLIYRVLSVIRLWMCITRRINYWRNINRQRIERTRMKSER